MFTMTVGKTWRNRFNVKCSYEQKVIDFFRTIEKRFWDKDTKEWSFPNTALKNFMVFMCDNRIDFEFFDTFTTMKLAWKEDKISVEMTSNSIFHQALQKAADDLGHKTLDKVDDRNVYVFEFIHEIHDVLEAIFVSRYKSNPLDPIPSAKPLSDDKNVKSKKFRK